MCVCVWVCVCVCVCVCVVVGGAHVSYLPVVSLVTHCFDNVAKADSCFYASCGVVQSKEEVENKVLRI